MIIGGEKSCDRFLDVVNRPGCVACQLGTASDVTGVVAARAVSDGGMASEESGDD